MNDNLDFVKKIAMEWQIVFDLPYSQLQIKYYTLCDLCASVVIPKMRPSALLKA